MSSGLEMCLRQDAYHYWRAGSNSPWNATVRYNDSHEAYLNLIFVLNLVASTAFG
jgi:hypothetical protein